MSKGTIEAAINGEGQYDSFAYFFHGDQYTKYNWTTDSVESGYPAALNAWNFPGRCADGIDAAFNGSGSSAGKAYFFKAAEYLRYDWEKDSADEGYPQQLSLWNLPGDFANGIDAAVSGKGQYEGKVYFFKGDQYVRYDLENDAVDDGYPQPLSAWNLPGNFSTGIHAALNGKLSYDGKLYFFKDNEYIRYDWATDKPDDLTPKDISAWGIKTSQKINNLNLEQIKGATCSSTVNAEKFMFYINETCDKYEINTHIRQLCFLSQVGHESGGLFYTEELASGEAYEGRKSLGNTVPGDGVLFKGRGLIQITGRANYKSLGDALGVDFTKTPALLGGKNVTTCTADQLKYAALSAGWFWNSRKLNALADQINILEPIDEGTNLIQFKEITKKINGGLNGLPDRFNRYKAGVKHF